MTPLQFVAADCANHEPDGSCLGIMIAPDLSMRVCRPLPRCLIADGKRCQYFEDCMVPMADWTTDPRLAASRQVAVAEYRAITNQKTQKSRPCPDCGESMPPRKRCCPACAIKRRRATFRRSWHAQPQPQGTASTVKPKYTPKSPMISGGIFPVSQNAIEDSHPPQIAPLTVEGGTRKTTP